MKKPVAFLIVLFAVASIKAQNLQLHYDFGKDRKYLTSTVEMWKADKWGSTFFFIDMNYDADNANTISLAYWEIARGFNLGKSPFAAHIEFNGGMGQFFTNPGYGAYSINNAWLTGLDYNFHNADFSQTYTLSALYKYIKDKTDATFQLTAVWNMDFFKKKVTFRGFADFWGEKNTFTEGETSTTTNVVFLTEPQIWYNFTTNIALGSEIEMASNFGGIKGFAINPTIGAKWQF